MIERERSNRNNNLPPKPQASWQGSEIGGAIDFPRLREQVSIADVLRVLDFEPSEVHGHTLRGLCPVHGSTNERSRSFSVNLDRNIYQCFAACCGSKGNQLDLFAAATRQPIYLAAVDLCKRLGLPIPRLFQRR